MKPGHEKIIQIFESKVKLNDEESSALIQHWNHERSLKRNDFLIEKEQVESSLFFVIEGSLRIYYPYEEDEICVGFGHTNNLVCSYPSFIRQQPSAYYIQALAPTKTIAIHQQDFYNLFDHHPKIERAWRMLEEEALLGKIERETEMLTFTAEERYSRLLQRSPHIFQHIPRKYIASYLRMSPETLSRLRPA